MNRKYFLTSEQEQYIRDNYGKLSQSQLASALNVSINSIIGYAKKNGLTSAKTFGKAPVEWSDTEILILKEYYPVRTNAEMLTMLPDKSEKQVYRKANALGIKKDKVFWGQYMKDLYANLSEEQLEHRKKTQFKKGQISHNKGVKMPQELRDKLSRTWFQKGNVCATALYDGAITIRKDASWGQIQFIRIAKSKWIPLHQHVWQQASGKLEKGHVIAFKDGDTANCDISNLEQISRAELMRRNSIVNYGKEYQSLSLTIASFNRKLKKYYQQHLKRQ